MSTGNELVTLKQVDNYYKDLRKRSAPVIFNSAVGNPAVFSDGADGLPIQSLKVNLLPRQEGTGDPSPQNIRSILPWDGLTVFGVGKNLLDDTKRVKNNTNVTVFIGQTVTVVYPLFLKAGKYTISAEFDDGYHYAMYYKEQNENQVQIWSKGGTDTEKTFTVENDGNYRFWLYDNNGIDETKIGRVWLNTGETATAYEPYKPITETDISFPSPVYGGTLDVVSGVLKVEWKAEILDDVNAWTQGSTFISYTNHEFNDREKGNAYTGVCSALPIKNNVPSGTAYMRWGGTEASNILISANGSDLTLEDVKTLSGQGKIVLCYPLATPKKIQLTPQQITAIVGDNTIWSDANGDIEVEYRADTKLFLKQNTVKDIQVNGSSVLNDGVANIPLANGTNPGVVIVGSGLSMDANGKLYANFANSTRVKAGTASNYMIGTDKQH